MPLRYPPILRPIVALMPSRQRSSRPATFYDSPGMLQQSHHWGAAVIWTIAASTTAGLLWAFLGKVDQTVVAVGTLEPVSGKLMVKSPSPGIVRQISVKEGDMVTAGQPLALVENDGLEARLLSVRKQLALLAYENALYGLLLSSPNNYRTLSLPAPDPLVRDDEKTRAIQLTVLQAAAQLRQLNLRLASQRRTLALKQDLLNSLRVIYRAGGLAKFNYLTQVDEVQRLDSEISQTREQLTTVLAASGRQVSVNQRQILDLQAQLTGLQEGKRNLTLKAQRSGRIFNLQVGRGSVIAAGSEVMRIIPEGALKAALYISNADVGFVRTGQAVKLSVTSFPSSEYGYLNGVVSRIGADAFEGTEDPSSSRRANSFPMSVSVLASPKQSRLVSRLQPGMQVSANIIVRQRPVITLLTDVFTKGTESLKNSR